MHGPVKHDHLLKELKSRLLFDLHIDQYVHTDVLVEHCDIKWGDASHHSDYTYFLSLIVFTLLFSSLIAGLPSKLARSSKNMRRSKN